MKKASKLLSALLLLSQVVGYTPTVLANEYDEPNKAAESQSETIYDETVDSNVEDDEQSEITTDDTMGKPAEDNLPPNLEEQQPDLDKNEGSDEVEKPTLPDVSEENQIPGTTDDNEQNSEDTPQKPKPESEQSTKPKDSPKESSQTSNGIENNPAVIVSGKDISPHIITEETEQRLQVPTEPIQEGNIYFEKNETVENFIRKIGESARKIGHENDLFASVMIAQAILESAGGQSKLAQAPNYNLFGIKGTYNGKGVSFITQEDAGNGTLYSTRAIFRQYKNYEESLKDYAKLLKEGLVGDATFYKGVWKSNAKTYQEATSYLTGRYATDTTYDKKLNGLIETYELTVYDKEVAGPKLAKEGYIEPLKNYSISSPFGWRGGEFHRGLDMAANQGEPIYASKAGTVLEASYHNLSGNYVTIEHEDGSVALYAHQLEYCVQAGQQVEQGQIIGYVGSTGNSTGPHLHLEICQDRSLVLEKLIDPLTVLK